MYFVKTPPWLKKIYGSYCWHIATKEPVLYLSFDDGPHETATPFVLRELKKRNAKATFFCVGKNVDLLPELYLRLEEEGHATGNHTYHHLNGWKTNTDDYLNDVEQAAQCIRSRLFRPPYGRITARQGKALKQKGFHIVMWDVLSADFDTGVRLEKCVENIIRNARAGSIIVFHDSTKALPRMQFALPRILDFFGEKGFGFRAIEAEK